MEKKFTVDYLNSKKIIARTVETSRKIDDIVHHQICKTRDEATRRVNKLVYEMAEEQGISVYDICFRTMPDYEFVNKFEPGTDKDVMRCIGEMRVVLRPLEFDFEKNGSYWKKKYFRLKEKMQELINNKDD